MATIFKPGSVLPNIEELREICGGKCPRVLHVEGRYGATKEADVWGFASMLELIQREVQDGNRCGLEPFGQKVASPSIPATPAPKAKAVAPKPIAAAMPSAGTQQQPKGTTMSNVVTLNEAELDARIASLKQQLSAAGLPTTASGLPSQSTQSAGRPVHNRRSAATAKAKELWTDAEVRHHNRARGESAFIAEFCEAVECHIGDFGYRVEEAIKAVASAPANQRAAVAQAEIVSNRVRHKFGTPDVLLAVAELRA